MLTEAITKAIQNNLPEVVASELKAYLSQAEVDKKNVEVLIKENKDLRDSWRQTEKLLNEARSLLNDHDKITLREVDVTKRENALSVTMAEHKAIAAEDRAQGLYDLTSIIFRNSTVRRTLSSNIASQNDYSNGNMVRTPVGSSEVEETTEE